MRRSRLFAILSPAVALVISACSTGHAPSGTVFSPTAEPTRSATPAARALIRQAARVT